MLRISYPKRLALLLIAALVGVGLTACDPSDPVQLQQWFDLNPDVGAQVTAETMNEPQRAVVSHLQDQQLRYLSALAEAEQARATDCYGEIRQVWPSSMWSWADGIVRRESRNQPGARNGQSVSGNHASGCWQLLLPLHAGRFSAAGCSSAQWADPLCNTKAAYQLYLAAGTSPWRL